MAKNAVTDWSATDSLNTDVGGTNIAEGCAPGGINDAIRKVMAQIASFITGAVFGGVTINGSTPTLSLNGGGGSNDGTVLLYTGGTLKSTVRSSSGGGLLASDAHTFKNLSESITYLGLGANVAAFGAAGTFGGPLSSGGAIRAAGTGWTNVNQGAAVELSHSGSGGSGSVVAIDRTTGLYQPISVQGTNVSLQPQGGGVYSGGNHVVQGIGILGGSALGTSGQLRFDRADGTANMLNISLAAGNTFLFNNSDAAAAYSFRLNNAERLAVSNTAVSAPVPIVSTSNVRAGLTSVGRGAVQIVQGDASNAGYLEFLNTTGSSTGYFQQAIGGDINYVNGASAGHSFAGNYLNVRKSGIGGLSLAVGSGSLTGKLVMTDAAGNPSASIGGQTIGQPTLYSNNSGHVFNSYISATGLVEGVTPGFGTTGGLRSRASPGGSAIVQFTTNDVSLELASIVADPGGGKLYFIVGLTPVMSIDAAGNIRVLGSFIPNTTP